ncbi:MAG: hypothetical protein GEU75_12195 [Dehalococcoidia bacterium]|nr:hypothetical protein [Dehalococcoidia bacterium]
MEWGILIIVIILLFTSYVIIQETRAQMHWRGLVQEGDLDAIRTLVENEIEAWHTQRVPRGTPALLWHGVQTVELIDVTADGVHVGCNAEGESALVNGRRVETSSPLTEGMKITLKLAEMLLYDIPNVKLDHVQIDVYTSFRDASGRPESRCILSTRVERSLVEHIDWEETAAPDFITLNEGRFAEGGSDALQAVEPLPWSEGAPRRS